VSISGFVIESSFSKNRNSLEQLITLQLRVAMLELSNVTARSDHSGQASRFRPEWSATRNGHSLVNARSLSEVFRQTKLDQDDGLIPEHIR